MIYRLATALAATLLLAVASGADAATVTCPGGGTGVTVTLTTSSAATCDLSGNGNSLTGTNDPINMEGYVTLDATFTVGLLTLTIPAANSGNFSFTTSPTYTSYVLGLQTSTPAPTPDYFAFDIPDGVTQGSFSISDTGTRVIGAVLYGKLASPVPGPMVGAGLPGLIAAFGGLLAWRRRRMVVA